MESKIKLNQIIELLGEDNSTRLKNKITDLLIEKIADDLNGMDVYLIDFESMFEKIQEDVETNVRERIFKDYVKKVERKFNAIVGEAFK